MSFLPEEKVRQDAIGSVRLLGRSGVFLILLGSAGFILQLIIRRAGLARPAAERYNIFFYLYERNEAPFLLILIGFGLFTLLVSRFPRKNLPGRPAFAPIAAIIVSLAVLVVARAGEKIAFHDYGLSMDEYAAEFQSRIFASGHLAATVPRAWRPYAWAVCPVFVDYDPLLRTWQQGYLPVYAAFRAMFLRVGAERWTNPFFGAVSILLIAAVSRRLWPDEPGTTAISVLFLALSSQFLLMSMTGFSSPAHLCLNLLWLYFFARDDVLGWWLLPWVGVLALGLHNPFVHALFVAPFLIVLPFRQPRRRVAYVVAVYAFGVAVWLGWTLVAQPLSTGAGLLSVFGIPGGRQFLLRSMSLVMLFSWQTPLAALLLITAFCSWKRLSRTSRLLASGLCLTYFFYFLYPEGQQHGWGDRYAYGVLGNLALLAAGAWSARFRLLPGLSRALLGASIAISILFQIPRRLLDGENLVGRFASAFQYVRTLRAPVVGIDVREFWYAQDLVRNDPLLATPPVFVHLDRLSPGERRSFLSSHGAELHTLSAEEMKRFHVNGD